MPNRSADRSPKSPSFRGRLNRCVTRKALPNFGSRNGPTELERGTPVAQLAPKLQALGADVQVSEFTSGTQAIVRTRDGWIGGADPRREGIVLGE